MDSKRLKDLFTLKMAHDLVKSPLQIGQNTSKDALFLKIVSDLVQMHKVLLTKLDKLEEIEPSFRQPEDGKDYTLTEDDKRDIASRVNIPIVDRIIEKTETIVEKPIEIIKIIETVDREEIKEEILEEVLNKIPKEKDVFEEVTKHPNKKLYPKHITGLEQTLHAFETQLKSKGGYLHGGGDTVGAGSNITIVEIGGKKIISSTGGGSTFIELDPIETPDGSNTVFTFTQKPTYIISDGVKLRENSGWTWNVGLLQATLSVPPQYSLWGEII